MLVRDRQRFIAARVRDQSSVETVDLARRLSVSVETIRRDLIELEERGIVHRVYGGAVSPFRRQNSEPPATNRSEINPDGKARIGRLAASIVKDAKVVFLDMGTTCAAIARELAPTFRGTLVTNSLQVADEFSDAASAEVIMTPGRLRVGERSVTGPACEHFLRQFHFDHAFLGCGGVNVKEGATDFFFDDIESKRTVAATSSASYLVADVNKIGVCASFKIMPFEEIGTIITDEDPPAWLADGARNVGVRLRVAKEGKRE